MVFEYIESNFEKDEPFFIHDLPFKNKSSLRQELKRLTDEGKIERIYNGVYCRSYTSILGTKGTFSFKKYINKRYLTKNNKTVGYITGIGLANLYGFTTQFPSVYEISSNEASTKQRKLVINGNKLIVYSPITKITDKNISSLQFLDLMTNIDKYSELKGEELKNKLLDFIKEKQVDFNEVKKIINLYPDRVYKNIYQGGIMSELL